MTSLDNLEERLIKIDNQFAEDSRLNKWSFHKTQNELLGLKGNSKEELKDFTVFMPWKQWSSELNTASNPLPGSALEDAIANVLQEGKDADTCFIDMCTMDMPDRDLMIENFVDVDDGRGGKKRLKFSSVRDNIANLINSFDGDEKKIVIRVLCGGESQVPLDEVKRRFQEIFWPPGDHEPVKITKNATLYIGYYSPTYDIKADPSPLVWLQKYGDNLKLLAAFLESKKIPAKQLAEFANKLASWKADDILIELGVNGQVRAGSWNHGKMLAVNGKTLLTGGANLWKENKVTVYDIIEHSVKIKGDAAISAHMWSDYFWRYLNKAHQTDKTSLRLCTNLKGDSPQWSTAEVPMSSFASRTGNGKYKVLTTSLLGDWHGSMNDLEYPVQIVQALRDIVCNLVWQEMEENPVKPTNIQGLAVILADALFSEDQTTWDNLSKLIGSNLSNPYKVLRINPTAWSSRIARLAAIANAKDNVILCQQRLTLWKVLDNERITKINNKLTLKKAAWDGYTWPYDLLIAIGYAIAGTNSASNGQATVRVVLTTDSNDEGGPQGGWGDTMHVAELKKRLKEVMTGMAMLQWDFVMDKVQSGLETKGVHLTNEQMAAITAASQVFGPVTPVSVLEVENAVETKFQVKRVLKGDQRSKIHFNHCKIVCVDDHLMYCGSDNAYPSYNEEHGVWIEDKSAIRAWKEKFWNELWENRTFVPNE